MASNNKRASGQSFGGENEWGSVVGNSPATDRSPVCGLIHVARAFPAADIAFRRRETVAGLDR